MKNILLKNLVVFVMMSILNFLFSMLVLSYMVKLSAESWGMAPFIIWILCLAISFIGLITVIIFKRYYQSLLRTAILFEILYLFILIISGTNPFLYFFEKDDENFFNLSLYINSFIVFAIIYLVISVYSKIILAKSKN
ncbi:hypothetical protein SAMN05880574_1434 [Chryseobacterium sp. RU37D]|uniref:hypothetical protein n=1 Tax=Chryseobacterium sp. RU37D TaxID=1907397 RepID=UPI0009566320|nr:hypothetical protein [Chryseobacterium sp. RU37D]SIQ97876.1 hypothetical protein SAMN05880574_1434 [Chryseobacterium sp. RU37D]